jgi:hypothetical protein
MIFEEVTMAIAFCMAAIELVEALARELGAPSA